MKEKVERSLSIRKLNLEFNDLERIVDKWGYFRQLYLENMPEIFELARKDICLWAGVYNLDWVSFFSPIERIAWGSIRDYGGIVLYPQFPLFNYFIDFANPYLRIGLELDGKDYHDPEKDEKRDQFLYEYGWIIYRVSGKECYHHCLDLSQIEEQQIEGVRKQDEIKNWLLNSCDGLVFAIRYFYFMDLNEKEYYKNIYLFPNDEYSDRLNLEYLVKETLQNHSLVTLDF